MNAAGLAAIGYNDDHREGNYTMKNIKRMSTFQVPYESAASSHSPFES